MTHRSTVHCQNDCLKCPHYPQSEWCAVHVDTDPGMRWEHKPGTAYRRAGECCHCGVCCGECIHLQSESGSEHYCGIYEDQPQACQDFPTICDLFQPSAVPDECTFIVITTEGRRMR